MVLRRAVRERDLFRCCRCHERERMKYDTVRGSESCLIGRSELHSRSGFTLHDVWVFDIRMNLCKRSRTPRRSLVTLMDARAKPT